MQKGLRMPRLLILFFASVFVFSLFFAPIISLSSYESLNSVLVIVGPKSISSLDYEEGVERYKNLSRFFPIIVKKDLFIPKWWIF